MKYLGTLTLKVYLNGDGVVVRDSTDLSKVLAEMQTLMSNEEKSKLVQDRRRIAAETAKFFLSVQDQDRPRDVVGTGRTVLGGGG